MTTGKVIAIEGIDASGKHTQTLKVVDWLQRKRFLAETIAFPNYESASGKAILAHLKGEWFSSSVGFPAGKSQYDAIAFQALQLFNRAEEASKIREGLGRGVNWIFDRYWPSGYAYGGNDGLDPFMLVDAHSVLPEMDLAIFVDITPEESVRRRPDRRDRYEKQPGLMEQVRARYLELFHDRGPKAYPRTRWIRIDGMMSEEAVTNAITYEVEKTMREAWII